MSGLSWLTGEHWRRFGVAVAAAGLASCSTRTECRGQVSSCLKLEASAGAGGAFDESAAGGVTAADPPRAVGGAKGEPTERPRDGGDGGATDAGDWLSLVTGAELGLAGDAGFDGPGFGNYCDDPSTETKSLDMVVTENFIRSGYYDDSASEMTVLDSAERAPQAVGTGLELHWLPRVRDFVGLALQNKPDNWLGAGHCVEPGATKVHLQARGAQGGELVHFGAVEPGRTGVLLDNQVLTAEWQTYAIDLTGVDYNHYAAPGGVRVGLSIVLANAALGEQWVYVDDIRWVGAEGQP